ncbi:MAG TPA: Fe-S-containing hydro-lyase [Fibrobacteres bacterium]|jgi:fumarate hydratase subunit beta|nr:Fe-S-containing hydro-lyase [Fibrobacterota bacterium]
MNNGLEIELPLDESKIKSLKSGDVIFLSGIIFTARDAAHRRFFDLITSGKPLPLDLSGQVIYYCGPTPPPPDKATGSAGPTTSGRMDGYTPLILQKTGLKGMIGKGGRSPEVIDAIVKNVCVYFAAAGGAGALLSSCIKKSTIVCYEDLGAEAVRRLEVEKMPVIAAIDCYGNNLYVDGPKRFLRNICSFHE